MENSKDYYSINELKEVFSNVLIKVKKNWIRFIVAFIGFAFIGFGYYKIQKPKYTATCTFILEEKQGGMGSLGSIASQFGFDLGGMGGGNSLFVGDNILDILKSKRIVQQVLLMPDGEDKNETLADLYLNFSGLKEKWKENPDLRQVYFHEYSKLNNIQDSVLNIIYDNLIKKNLIADRANKKGSIIKVEVTAENRLFARLMTERLVDEASKMYMNVKIGTAKTNVEKMQRKSDSLLYLLNSKSYTVAASQVLDVNPGLRTASVPVEIASRDKAVIATLYSEVTKNLEASKLLLSQQTPVIQLLDLPGQSIYDHKKGLLFSVVIFSLIGGMFFLAVNAFYFYIRFRNMI